jgi:hypothetical protein
MTRSRPITFLAGAAAMKISSDASATVGVANDSLGSILVCSSGRTLGLFKAESGIKSASARTAAVVERHAARRARTDRLQARNDHSLGRQPAGPYTATRSSRS